MKQLLGKKKLKIIFLLLSISIPLISKADVKVTLQWESIEPGVDGYQIFCREEGQSYDYENFLWQGDNSFNQYTVDGLDEDKTYYFVIRSFTGDQASHDSNEVCYPNCAGKEGESNSGCMIQSLFS
ncbi:MAG: fibronectin type III domain-containing protein [Desulfobacteraceae bacterium]|jgi:hypothetical protein